MKAAIVYKNPDIVDRVAEVLKKMNVDADIFSKSSEELEDYDFIVSIGGDGTILGILQKVKKCPPIFGINTGRIGLLTHSDPSNFEERLRKAVRNFEIEEFQRMECKVGKEKLLALNEIVFVSESVAKLITVTVKIDGIVAENVRCDGMIVATQIGSTGYAFSAGGPVVEPYLDSFIVVPLAPFRYGWKPLVVRSDRVIEIKSSRGIVIADGHSRVSTDRAIIKRAKYPAVFFKKEGRLEILFNKIKKIE